MVDNSWGELIMTINAPEMKTKLVAQGVEPLGMTHVELGTFQKAKDNCSRDQGGDIKPD